ncbi:unnamed protein product, partial [Adineta steineri]
DLKTSTSPNLIQKLLFRQFSPKTRPYSMTIPSDNNASTSTISNDTLHNYAGGGRRITTPTASKNSWLSSSSSSNTSKQNNEIGENLLTPP